MKKLLVLIFVLLPTLAMAQSQRNPCYNTNLSNGNQNCIPVGTSTPLPVNTATSNYQNITTSTNTIVKGSPATIGSLIINTAGTGSTAKIYDNKTCTGTVIGTFSTTAQGTIPININTKTGLCLTTTGSPAANITLSFN